MSGRLFRGAEAHHGIHDGEAAYPWRHVDGYQAGEDDGGHAQVQTVDHVAMTTTSTHLLYYTDRDRSLNNQ